MRSSSPLPFEQYKHLSEEACKAKITEAKHQLKDDLLILGHHYQREEVYRFADKTGDSLQLSRLAAETTAKYIVFCGVHFMAEVADMLTTKEQVVILPDLAAGCSMADMANRVTVERCWRELSQVCSPDTLISPITYINSAANLKEFCGEHGGFVCTSTNAKQMLEKALTQRPKALFFPDQHLGRYTGHTLGIPLEKMAVWDFMKPMGGLTPEQIEHADLLLWKGHCSVHQMFTLAHIQEYKKQHPEVKVIAHPECDFEVCMASDAVGSTDFIIRTIKNSEPGSHWLVGTELNLVERLHKEVASENKKAVFMSPTICMCSTMYRIDLPHLAWALDNLVAGTVVNQITVPENVAKSALTALNKMYS